MNFETSFAAIISIRRVRPQTSFIPSISTSITAADITVTTAGTKKRLTVSLPIFDTAYRMRKKNASASGIIIA